MIQGILLRVAILLILALGISYFFDISLYWALIASLGFGIFGAAIHLPENMPGKCDNPDDEEPHPYKVLALSTIGLFILIWLGNYFPVITKLGVN